MMDKKHTDLLNKLISDSKSGKEISPQMIFDLLGESSNAKEYTDFYFSFMRATMDKAIPDEILGVMAYQEAFKFYYDDQNALLVI